MIGGARVGAAALAALLVVGAGIVWRAGVVAAVPASAGLYTSLGLPVNPVGVVIENVRAEPTLQDGHAALAVRGILKSVSDRSRRAPPLRIVLFDAAGRKVAARIAAPGGLAIPAGGEKRFAVAILDPPMGAHDLEVSFAPSAERTERARPLAAANAPTPPLGLKGLLVPLPPAAIPTGPQAPQAATSGSPLAGAPAAPAPG
ncbi:MAG: DUF3426 domain-containing protein [Caulobacteraceae bacterium]